MPKIPVMNVGGSNSADTIDSTVNLLLVFSTSRALSSSCNVRGAFLKELQVVDQTVHPGGDTLADGDGVIVEPVRALFHQVDEHERVAARAWRRTLNEAVDRA